MSTHPARPAARTETPRIVALRAALNRVGLPAWFVAIDVLWVARFEVLGIDARHYQRAASEWLAGGNPWSVTESGIPFASGPHTLLFYAPTSLIPLDAATGLWMLAGLLAAMWLVRRLDLPLWWIAFPPLAHALWNGNPHSLVVALLLVSTGWASTVATALKLYAGLQLLFRPRQLVAAGLVLVAALPLVPWQLYLEQGLGVSSHLETAWNGSAWRWPILVPPTVLALWLLRTRGAEWYSIPALFPATQFYYVATVLPAVATRPLVAAIAAAPVPLLIPALVLFMAGQRPILRFAERMGPSRFARRAVRL